MKLLLLRGLLLAPLSISPWRANEHDALSARWKDSLVGYSLRFTSGPGFAPSRGSAHLDDVRVHR